MRVAKMEFIPPMTRRDWKIKDNTIKIYNELKLIGKEVSTHKILKHIKKLAKQEQICLIQASEKLWNIVKKDVAVVKRTTQGR